MNESHWLFKHDARIAKLERQAELYTSLQIVRDVIATICFTVATIYYILIF